MTHGVAAASDRKRQRIHHAVADLVAHDQPVTIAAVARIARVSRTLCYEPELRAMIDAHRRAPAYSKRSTPASVSSLQADLEHARHQLRQLDDDNRLLRDRLARSLGDDLDHRLTQPQGARLEELEQRAAQLAVENVSLQHRLDEREHENAELSDSLSAARIMNRELMTRLNSRSHS